MKTPHRLLNIASVLVLCIVSPLVRAQTYTDMHDFNNSDGCCANYPSLLAQGEDGNIYGATTSGGSGAGNIFKITPTGTFTNLFNFDGTHGRGPQGGLSLGFDGNFYGTTYQGGTSAVGTVFKITPSGAQTVLYNFTNTTDGAYPKVPPVQAPDGNLTTPQKFKVIPTISSFSPKSGPVGTQVMITGMSLKQTSGVTIGKAKATFTVNSDTQVTATGGTRCRDRQSHAQDSGRNRHRARKFHGATKAVGTEAFAFSEKLLG